MKITKLIFSSIIFLLLIQTAIGQTKESEFYKNLYKIADSINKLGRPFSIDSTTKIEVKKIDKEHPMKYFEKAADLLNTNKFNDAAFLYYLGILRYSFYNSANPSYQASSDGALAASLKYVMGRPINMYLRTNIDNFISALQFTIDYYKNNDYDFYPRQKNADKYNSPLVSFSSLINELEKNKDKYKKEWEQERNSILKND